MKKQPFISVSTTRSPSALLNTACRWRTHKEVVEGKGHFLCGAKGCGAKDGLVSYEVNFAYEEAGRQKQVRGSHAR